MHHLPFQVTIETEAHKFQYKLLNRIQLFTNKVLFKWNITDTCKCTFCSDYDETVEHLLYKSN